MLGYLGGLVEKLSDQPPACRYYHPSPLLDKHGPQLRRHLPNADSYPHMRRWRATGQSLGSWSQLCSSPIPIPSRASWHARHHPVWWVQAARTWPNSPHRAHGASGSGRVRTRRGPAAARAPGPRGAGTSTAAGAGGRSGAGRGRGGAAGAAGSGAAPGGGPANKALGGTRGGPAGGGTTGAIGGPGRGPAPPGAGRIGGAPAGGARGKATFAGPGRGAARPASRRYTSHGTAGAIICPGRGAGASK